MDKIQMEKLLKEYEAAYYSGEAIVSDEEYDALKDRYEDEFGDYNYVPNEGEIVHFQKVKHLYPLKSLAKYQISDEEGIRKELTRLWPVVIQPKLDGLSIEIRYVQGKGLTFITRGDGKVGDDVTAQCLQITSIETLEKLFTSCKQSFRAEIVMTHSDFSFINARKSENGEEPLSNCRNGAAGMLRNKDTSKVQGLTVIIYEDLSSTDTQRSVIKEMKKIIYNSLRTDNIRIVDNYTPRDIDDAIRMLNELENYRSHIDYDIDGWVVKSDVVNSLEVHGGYTGHHPKNAFAVKGEAKGAWTKIKSITWQVGKEYITPVAILEPVEIDGSNISRATLHNLGFLEAIGFEDYIYNSKKLWTEVKVVKANDVIPRIVEVKHHREVAPTYMMPGTRTDCFKGDKIDINAPSKCPSCGADTAIKETNSSSKLLICTGANCPAKLQKRIEQLASRDGLNIVGLSEGTIKKILDTYDVKEPGDILHMTKEEILELEGFAETSATNLYNALQKAVKEQPIDRVLYAAAIPLLGRSCSKDICKEYSKADIEAMCSSLDEDGLVNRLLRVKDIGEVTARSIAKNIGAFEYLFNCIEKVNDIERVATPLIANQLTICITGQREPFKTIIEKAGHKVSGSVSKKTAALVNANGETSSKATKAEELGIPIITTEQELRDFIGE